MKLKEELKKAEEQLAKERNLNQISFYEGYIKGLKYAKEYADWKIKECLPEKDNYSKDLLVHLGAGLMATMGMENGFEEYKKLEAIDEERNVGWNACIDQILANKDKK